MNSYQFSASINALANAVACKLSTDEISLLAVFFVQLGDTLATIATHKTLCDDKKD